ncbi:DUF6221 family protein [Nocardia wallacei]|uniref:DUF6221 family protein n=1 Tax=Nocardia wallacei TaxID=480035 RepID=UPI00245634B4|nr:DUF6221 family protein [Nocardia wallacei]
MTIEEFIEARIAEREERARTTIEIDQKYTADGYSHEYEWASILVNPQGKRQGSFTFAPGAPSPDEVLRQCAAIRASVEALRAFGNGHASGELKLGQRDRDAYIAMQLHPIAAIWSDHPDYREEWAL